MAQTLSHTENSPVVSPPLGIWLWAALSAALIGGALYVITVMAQPDVQLGIVQKIFYFHVGSAFAMLLLLSAGSVLSLLDLLSPGDRIDALARACIEVGVIFALLVLTSGPLWARKSWGAYWTWEPRLTLTLLVTLVSIAVMAIRDMAGDGARRMGAAMAVLAGPTSYLIHIAVQKWGGTHPSVLQGGGIQSPQMRLAFWLSVAALLTFAGLLVRLRMQGIRLEQTLAALKLDISAREIRRARRLADGVTQP